MIQLEKKENAGKFSNSLFNTIAVGSAYELLRHDVMQHLQEIQEELHFKYCRFHGLFHDNMAVVRRLSDGSIGYQWHHIDKMIDNLLSVGLKPFMQLGAMPEELASRHDFYAFEWKMNTSPPKDYNEWGALIENFVQHVVNRYGLDEVKTWYFEVWNEPNIGGKGKTGGFWSGEVQEYIEKLYPYAARAVKKVDEGLRVGGPATAGAAHIPEFIDYCSQNNIPLDFITGHEYPLGEQCSYKGNSPYKLGEFFPADFKRVKDEVEASPMPGLEIHWTEWNTMSTDSFENISWLCNEAVDNRFGAACIAHNMLSVRDLCDSVAYWVASDIFSETGLPHSVFSCTYGLVNNRGIKKATYNAYKLLRKMRGNVLECKLEAELNVGYGMAATEEKGITRIMAYNQHHLQLKEQPTWIDKVSVPVAEDGEFVITSAKISEKQGSAFEAWRDMDAPQDVTPIQEEYLRFKSMPEYELHVVKSKNKIIEVEFELKPNEVMYIEIEKKGMKAMPRAMSQKELDAWNEKVMYPERK